MSDQPDLLRPDDDTNARRRELVRDLALRGGFSDKRLRDLVWDRLGAAAFSDEALRLLDRLLSVLARDGGGDGQARSQETPSGEDTEKR